MVQQPTGAAAWRHVTSAGAYDEIAFHIWFSDRAELFYWFNGDLDEPHGGSAQEVADALRSYVMERADDYSVEEVEYAVNMIHYEEKQYFNVKTP